MKNSILFDYLINVHVELDVLILLLRAITTLRLGHVRLGMFASVYVQW